MNRWNTISIIYSNYIDNDGDGHVQRQLAICTSYFILICNCMTTRAPTGRCVSNVSLQKSFGKISFTSSGKHGTRAFQDMVLRTDDYCMYSIDASEAGKTGIISYCYCANFKAIPCMTTACWVVINVFTYVRLSSIRPM